MSGDDRIGEPAGAEPPRPASQLGPALGQAIAVGAAGSLAVPVALPLAMITGVPYWAGLLLALGLLIAAVYGLGTATRQGSALTGGAGVRVGWALLVAALGGYGSMVLAAAAPGLDGMASLYLLPAVGLALVSAALSRPRLVRLPAIALIVLLIGGTVLAMADRRAGELEQRLDHAGTEADLVFVTALPGYHEAEPAAVTPTVPFAVPYSPSGGSGGRITVWAARGGGPDCPPEPPGGYSERYPLGCVREAPERWYQTLLPDRHEYLTLRGDRVVHVRATRDVDRETLRAAADNVRQATTDELNRLLPELPYYLRR